MTTKLTKKQAETLAEMARGAVLVYDALGSDIFLSLVNGMTSTVRRATFDALCDARYIEFWVGAGTRTKYRITDAGREALARATA